MINTQKLTSIQYQRTNPAAAGKALAAIFADYEPPTRAECLKILRGSLQFLRRHYSGDRWTLNLHPEQSVRLIAGMVLCLQFTKSGDVSVYLANDSIPRPLLKRGHSYAMGPGCTEFHWTATRLAERYSEVRPGYFKALRICAEKRRTVSGHTKAASPGLVVYLSDSGKAAAEYGSGGAVHDLVVYHSERATGHTYVGSGDEFSFFSRKSEKTLQRALGQRVWAIASVGSTNPSYFLVGVYTPTRIEPAKDGVRYLSGSGVHFDPPIEASNRDWFKALFDEQNNFSFGNFNRIRAPEVIRGLDLARAAQAITIYPDELSRPGYPEGAAMQVIVNRYERNRGAREACLKRFGASCLVCGLDLAKQYGPIAKDLIHVHHLRPLSNIDESYEVNPETDLIPICPNCHAVAHREDPPLSPEQIRQFIADHSSFELTTATNAAPHSNFV